MSHAELIQAVRRLVLDVFSQLQPDNSHPREAILLRNGLYCGRKFEMPTGHAIWSFDSDRLEICSADGNVLSVIEHVSTGKHVGTAEPARRRAA